MDATLRPPRRLVRVLLVAPVLLASLAGCALRDEGPGAPTGEAVETPAGPGRYVALAASVTFPDAWDPDAARAAVESIGFVVDHSTMLGLVAQDGAGATLSLRNRAEGREYVHLVEVPPFAGSAEEIAQRAREDRGRLEGAFQETLGRFRQASGWSEPGPASWRPVVEPG